MKNVLAKKKKKKNEEESKQEYNEYDGLLARLRFRRGFYSILTLINVNLSDIR